MKWESAQNLNHLSPERIKEEASYEKSRYFLGRHDDAMYILNESIPTSEDPLGHFDKSIQPDNDLTESGKEHAREMAGKFLDNFDPKNDVIAMASSALTRSRETAAIYAEVAKELGFEIRVIKDKEDGGADLQDLKEDQLQRTVPRGQISSSLHELYGGNEIRTLDSLSLNNIEQMFVELLFHPDNYLDKVGDEYKNKIPNEYKKIWQEARDIIEADNKGSWGENFLYYSEQMQEMFDRYRKENDLNEDTIPHFASVVDMYKKNFRNSIRLMTRYDDDIESYEHAEKKKVRVLGFGHENQLLFFLDKEFNKTSVDKGSLVGFKILKDEENKSHIFASLPGNPTDPVEVEFPDSPYASK